MQQEVKIVKISQDIHDGFGRIYLRKGQSVKLDRTAIKRLEKLGLLEQVMQSAEGSPIDQLEIEKNRQTNKSEYSSNINIKKEISIICETIGFEKFQVANQNVKRILEGSREQLWYIHLNTLANYAEWYYSHSLNTALIAAMIAINLGYEGEKLKNLIIGALLHDIGMILIPYEIIYKKDLLNDEESRIQKKHCELGVAMVAAIDLADESRSIIKQHHERVDGMGYPLGLSGNEITEEAQIVMIADSFDAGTSARPYRAAKSSEEMIQEIVQSKGKYSSSIIESIKSIMIM